MASEQEEPRSLRKLLELPEHYPRKTPLNFLKVAGVESAEKVYSKLLAELLKSHVGTGLINDIIEHFNIECPNIPSNSTPQVETEHHIPKPADGSSKEQSFLDILICFNDTSPRLLIAIENKVGAGEGDGQIEKYQKALESEYKGYRGFIIFLTPFGRQVTTADKKSGIKCHSLSYSDLIKLLEALKTKGDTEAYITTFIHSIKENITMETNEKREAYEIWGKTGKPENIEGTV